MTIAPKPRARRDGIRIEAGIEVPVAHDDTTGEAFYLRPEWLATWERCDGARDVAAIAAEVDGDVWAHLDALGDLGLLEERVAPPAGSSQVTRRGLLRASAVAGAAVAAIAISARPVAASQANTEEKMKAEQNREGDKKVKQEQKEKRRTDEQQAKERQNKAEH